MAFVFFLGLGLALLAPLLRRFVNASLALAAGAFIVICFGIVGLVHVDPRIGLAAIESNRREYLFFLACEAPVLLLALISMKRLRWAFWLAWGINVALASIVVTVIVWLSFFWHW